MRRVMFLPFDRPHMLCVHCDTGANGRALLDATIITARVAYITVNFTNDTVLRLLVTVPTILDDLPIMSPVVIYQLRLVGLRLTVAENCNIEDWVFTRAMQIAGLQAYSASVPKDVKVFKVNNTLFPAGEAILRGSHSTKPDLFMIINIIY